MKRKWPSASMLDRPDCRCVRRVRLHAHQLHPTTRRVWRPARVGQVDVGRQVTNTSVGHDYSTPFGFGPMGVMIQADDAAVSKHCMPGRACVAYINVLAGIAVSENRAGCMVLHM